MNSTALGATNKTENGIMFKSNAHEKFYYEKVSDEYDYVHDLQGTSN